MTPQQRAELDARVAAILANTEAKTVHRWTQSKKDAIMMAVAQQVQAQWAAEEKAKQQEQQQTQPSDYRRCCGVGYLLAELNINPVMPSAHL